jgi:serine/threonine protein kinase
VIYCINPRCRNRQNRDSATICESCGTALLINQRFNLLRPIKEITQADEVEIYEALDLTGSYDSPPNEIKILKILKNESIVRKDAFRRGAQILMSLANPAIPSVDVDDFFEVTIQAHSLTLLCLAMSKIEGITLTEWVRTHGKITQDKAIAWLQEMAEILDYLHQDGVLHRDIKPDNIMVNSDGRLTLIDFDSARRMTDTYRAKLTYSTEPITAIASGIYTAAEQLDSRPVPQSDFYSLGMTLIFALTGRSPAGLTRDAASASGQLLWDKHTSRLDPPFIKFINDLTHPAITRRPGNSVELVNIAFVGLPRKLKRYKIYRSKVSRFGVVAIAALVGVGLFQLSQNGLYEYYFTSGNQAVEDNRFENARQHFKSAINILPKAEAYSNLGIVCSRLGDFDCARKAYQNAIKRNPNGWEGYFQLGSYYEDIVQPDLKQAESNYRKALLINQQAVQPLNNLARVLILQKRYQEAKSLITKGLKFTSEPYYESVLRKNFGWIHLEQKQYVEAEKYLKQAIAADSTFASPYCLLAKLYEVQKRTSVNAIESCLTKNGEDALNIEVLQWRNEMIKNLLRNKNKSTSTSEISYPS